MTSSRVSCAPLTLAWISTALLLGPAAATAADTSSSFKRPRILVWELSRGGVSQGEADAVAAAVTRWASKNAHLEVISHEDLARLLEVEANRLSFGNPDDGRLAEIAKKADADLVIFGRVTRPKRLRRKEARPKVIAELSLFEAGAARARHREKVVLDEVAELDDARVTDLGRAANALVGRVLERPALDIEQAAARLVEQLPVDLFEPARLGPKGRPKRPIRKLKPLLYGDGARAGKLGRQLATALGRAIAERQDAGPMKLKKGARLRGRYRENQDMVEIWVEVDRTRPAARAQVRLVRAVVDEADLRPGRKSGRRPLGQATKDELIIEAFTEKGRDDVVFAEGETFHLFVKMNQPGFARFVYHFADGETRVLMEQAWPIQKKDAGRVLQYPVTFGPAPPFGVEKIEVLGFATEPAPIQTVQKTIDGATYDVVVPARAFIRAPRSQTLITITTTSK